MRRVVLVAAALAAAAGLGATPARAATDADARAAAQRGAQWIRAQQDPATGGLGMFGGDWSMIALAATGAHAADVAAGGPSAQDRYQGEWSTAEWTRNAGEHPPSATDAARVILAGTAAGILPSRVAVDRNLVAALAARFDGRQVGEPGLANDDMFAILALKRADAPDALLRALTAPVRAAQAPDGGWAFTQVAAEGDMDMTGAAVGALCAAGVSPDDPAIARGLAYMRARQDPATGAFPSRFFGPNTDSAAWVLSGLRECGIDPLAPDWTTSAGRTGVDFLISQQNADGGFRWAPADTDPNFYATQDAVRPLAGFGTTPAPRREAGAPVWRPDAAVAPGTAVPVTLVLDHGPDASGEGPVRMCEVTAPAEATVGALLTAARTAARPAGCVTSADADGDRVSMVNGVADSSARGWKVSVDGRPASGARTAVPAGALVHLELAERQPAPEPEPERPAVTLPPMAAPPPAPSRGDVRTRFLGRSRALLRRGGIRVRLSCAAGAPVTGCRGAITARLRGGRLAGRASFALRPGERRTLPVWLRATAVRAATRRGRLRLALVAATRDPASGAVAVARRTVTVRSR